MLARRLAVTAVDRRAASSGHSTPGSHVHRILARAGCGRCDASGRSLPDDIDANEWRARADDDERRPVVRVLAPLAHPIGRLAHRFDAALAATQMLVVADH